jgi:hypothetical protein
MFQVHKVGWLNFIVYSQVFIMKQLTLKMSKLLNASSAILVKVTISRLETYPTRTTTADGNGYIPNIIRIILPTF